MQATAKIFMNGRSQAIRLPKEFRVQGNEVLIEKKPEGILIKEKSKNMLKEIFSDMPAFHNFDVCRDKIDNKPRAVKL